MSTISVVIITYNEEKNIERCIKSIVDIADEIIVIDSNSKDKTKEISHKYNVNFLNREWEGYSKAKNFGNQKVTSDYILSLDADEVVSQELLKEIKRIKPKLNGFYKFNRITNYAGKWVYYCGWYPDAKVRLFPKGEAEWDGDFVHEVLVCNPQIKIHYLKGDLLHYSYNNITDHLTRIEKYSSLHAEKMFAQGKTTSLFKLIFSPVFKFVNDYFFKLGFLDGKTGFNICFISAKAVYLKYKKLRLIDNK
jgi:glycosyltransferase involved in cell wall biosynthesis